MSLRYAARSNVGLIREGNEDSGYAGPSLLAVADGMGGHAAGEVASAVAVSTLATLEDDVPSTALLDALAASVQAANDAISDMVEKHPQLDGMGTTLTALLWSGHRIGLVHIGDSRAYLLREGALVQITHDHTFVQQLQDEGRITAAEAAIHPQRSLLLRALDGRSNPEPDLSVREAQLGDRYLVCSDGLSGVVSDAELALAMTDTTVEFAADTLIQLALDAGAPDNVTVIVADVVGVDTGPSEHPVVVGAAGGKHKAAAAGHTSEIDLSALPPAGKEKRRGGALWVRTLIAAVVIAMGVAGWSGYAWSQRQYYVGADSDQVAIFKGLPQKVVGKSLSETFERQDIALTDLPTFDRKEVRDTIFTGSIDKARKVVDRLRSLAINCQDSRAAAAEALALALGGTALGEGLVKGEDDPDAATSAKPDAGVTSGAPTPSPSAAVVPDPSASPTTLPTPSPADAILDGADVIAACGPAE
ncbi:MAG: PP2C family protein-serine/threonine phosphatase [Sporichthyaceae bacterium]